MRKISLSLLGLAILSFLLPWSTVSCGSQKFYTFSGIDLAIGETIKIPKGLGLDLEEEFKEVSTREGMATIAFIVGIAGMLAGFLIKNERARKVILSVCGGSGGILLYLLENKLSKEALIQGGGMIDINYHFGFYASMLLFFAVCIVNVLPGDLLKKVSLKPVQSTTLKGPPKPSFCTQCGAKVSPDDMFCTNCGHSLK